MRSVIFEPTDLLHKKEDFLLKLQNQLQKWPSLRMEEFLKMWCINETLSQKFHFHQVTDG